MDEIKYTYYTFIYCKMHDDGCIIKGHHDYVPAGYSMQHSSDCESCDWYNMGIIKYNIFIDSNDSIDCNDCNCVNIDIVKTVRVDYDIYDGGFMFCQYSNTLTDEKSNCIENEDLEKWIEDISTNKNKIVFLN